MPFTILFPSRAVCNLPTYLYPLETYNLTSQSYFPPLNSSPIESSFSTLPFPNDIQPAVWRSPACHSTQVTILPSSSGQYHLAIVYLNCSQSYLLSLITQIFTRLRAGFWIFTLSIIGDMEIRSLCRLTLLKYETPITVSPSWKLSCMHSQLVSRPHCDLQPTTTCATYNRLVVSEITRGKLKWLSIWRLIAGNVCVCAENGKPSKAATITTKTWSRVLTDLRRILIGYAKNFHHSRVFIFVWLVVVFTWVPLKAIHPVRGTSNAAAEGLFQMWIRIIAIDRNFILARRKLPPLFNCCA